MTPPDPAKEKRNKMILAVFVVMTVFLAFKTLYYTPLQNAAAESEGVIADLERKLARGERMLLKVPGLRRDQRVPVMEILEVAEKYLPPVSGRYSWALDLLSGVAHDAGVMISVNAHAESRFIPVRKTEKLDMNSVPYWIPYAVDVEFRATFDELITFLHRLYIDLPYCSVASMELQALPSSPEKHSVKIILEWPVPRFEEDLEKLRSQNASSPSAP